MYARVIIDITNEALDHAYTYRVPENLRLQVGDKVKVPFGTARGPRSAYVLQLTEQADFAPERIKDILEKDAQAISVTDQLMQLAVWMSREYGTTLNQCLKTVLPVKRSVRRNSRRIDPLAAYQEQDRGFALNEEQQAAAEQVIAGLPAGDSDNKGKQPLRYLLFGITGSGKTEVYLRIIEEVLQRGRQVILLIPEISLTYQTVLRVSARFRGRVAVMHSRMSLGERYEQYLRCARGEVDILVGPRSAIFAPFEKLGIIIMDEEHEGAYKSETAPRYETREVARQRALLAGCPVLYGSATPSLDLYTEARDGSVKLLRLTRRAHPGSHVSETEIADLREELLRGNRSVFSAALRQHMEEALNRKEQVMLFMNRRGYSSFVSCRSCGEAVRCPHCDVSLTLHRDGQLRCHYCGHQEPLMKKCPKCGSPYLAPFGFGTEKLETVTREMFPEARVLRMDADTTKRKGGHEAILKAFREEKADILIGTQMIVKGHDFPKVTVVGLIAADLSLSAPDFHAQERTFQLITQAAGRAGRDSRPGHVVIQTYQPEHYAILLACQQDYEGFYQREMLYRRMLGYPPQEHLLTIQLASGDENFLSYVAAQSVQRLQPHAARQEAELIGPLNAGIYRIKDIYRKIVYIKHPDHDIIIRLREQYQGLCRELDRRGLVLLNYDLQ